MKYNLKLWVGYIIGVIVGILGTIGIIGVF